MIFVLLYSVVIMVLLTYLILQKPKNYPPGPTFLPIIGSLYTVPAATVHKSIEVWKKQYGNIIGHKLGPRLVVFVRGYEEMKNGLKHPHIQDRPNSTLFTQRTLYKPLGFFFNGNNEHIHNIRRVVLKYFGTNCYARMDSVMTEEIQRFTINIKTDTPIEINNEFFSIPFNVIMLYLVGIDGAGYIDRFKELRRNIYVGFRSGRMTGIEVYFPFLRYFINQREIMTYATPLMNYIIDYLEEHRATLNLENIRDLIDMFLIKQKKFPEIFTDEQIVTCLLELIEAGNESVINTTGFIFLYLALHLDVQEKLHEELRTVLHVNKTVSLEDRARLPYLEAVISEAMRINTIAPLTVPRVVTEDTKFYNYDLPKGTQVVFSIWSIFHDATAWEKPEEFIPDRFIKEGQYIKHDNFIPFLIGKRNCVGEVFVRNILFLHTAMFFQKYSIHLVPGEKLPTTEALTGFTTAPKPFNVIIKRKAGC